MRLTSPSALALAMGLSLQGCAEGPIPAPPPQQTISPPWVVPKIVAQPVEPKVAAGPWVDAPLTPGNWVYQPSPAGSTALYGVAGASAHFAISCNRNTRQIMLTRNGATSGSLSIRATSGVRQYQAAPLAESPQYATASIAPADTQLDAVIYSRGRFLIAATGAPDIILPNWPEFARVVEDCRG